MSFNFAEKSVFEAEDESMTSRCCQHHVIVTIPIRAVTMITKNVEGENSGNEKCGLIVAINLRNVGTYHICRRHRYRSCDSDVDSQTMT